MSDENSWAGLSLLNYFECEVFLGQIVRKLKRQF